MTNRELLEQDRDRFLSALSQADSPDRAVRIAEEELNRILIRYNEQQKNPVLAEQNSSVYETAKAALSLMNTTGEVQVYERTASTDSSLSAAGGVGSLATGSGIRAAVIPFFTGIASGAAGFFLIAAAGILSLVSVCSVFIAGIRYAGGRLLPHRKKDAGSSGSHHSSDQANNLRIEVSQDAEKVYHSLLGIVTVIDQTLTDTALRLEIKPDSSFAHGNPAAADSDSARPAPGNIPGISFSRKELVFLQNLLATAYGDKKNSASAQMISDIRFHLHGEGIEVLDAAEDYDGNMTEAFDRLPGGIETTLRPAFVKNGSVLLKGLVSGS